MEEVGHPVNKKQNAKNAVLTLAGLFYKQPVRKDNPNKADIQKIMSVLCLISRKKSEFLLS